VVSPKPRAPFTATSPRLARPIHPPSNPKAALPAAFLINHKCILPYLITKVKRTMCRWRPQAARPANEKGAALPGDLVFGPLENRASDATFTLHVREACHRP